MNKFSLEEIQNILPENKKKLLKQSVVDKINDIINDDMIGEEYKQNFVTHTGIIKNGVYSIKEYMSAMHFTTLKLLGDTDIEAYSKVFPDRYNKLVASGLSRSRMGPYVSNYKKSKLVNKIIEQSLVPSHILNAPLYQQALNQQVYLMNNAKSEMVQHQAAKVIMENLKQPEIIKLETDTGDKKNMTVEENEAFMLKIAKEKLELMKMGGDVKAIANMSSGGNIIDVEEVK